MRLAFALLLLAVPAAAHDGIEHASSREAAAHRELPGEEPTPLPFKLGGTFELTDQNGARRTESDPSGAHQLRFFGYASCQAICPVAFSLMEDAAAIAAANGARVQPLLVTVDPARDTPEAMAAAMAARHPGTLGLTGTEAELAHVRALYQVERKVAFEDPEFGPVYAHGSHIYLLDPAGVVLTLIPPVVAPERAAEIILKYLRA